MFIDNQFKVIKGTMLLNFENLVSTSLKDFYGVNYIIYHQILFLSMVGIGHLNTETRCSSVTIVVIKVAREKNSILE